MEAKLFLDFREVTKGREGNERQVYLSYKGVIGKQKCFLIRKK